MSVPGIVQRKAPVNATYINIKYSATAGLLYVDNQEVQKGMDEIRAEYKQKFGPKEIPRYDEQQNTDFFVSRMIEKNIIGKTKDGKVDAIAIFGRVTNVQLQQNDSDNKLETDYLKVTFEVGENDKLNRLVVSLDFNHKLAQNLIPRLLTIQPGQLAYFCPKPFFNSDDKEKRYPVHGVMLNDEHDKPIKRIEGFLEKLKTKQEEFLSEIRSSGADMKDPDVDAEVKMMLEAQRKAFFMGMFNEVERRFAEPRKQLEEQLDQDQQMEASMRT